MATLKLVIVPRGELSEYDDELDMDGPCDVVAALLAASGDIEIGREQYENGDAASKRLAELAGGRK